MEEEYQQISKKRKIQNPKFNNNNNNNNSNNTKLTARRCIKMYCPKSAKTAKIMAWDDQRLDLGSIARMFGIEPVSLRLNGHLISIGVDLIASSVTWRSLVSFFSSKGLSTGIGSSGALLVDGKLSKCGTKRGGDPAPELENRRDCVKQRADYGRIVQFPDTEVISLPNSKRLKENNNYSKTAKCSDTGWKRKNWLENFSPLIKKARVEGRYSNGFPLGLEGREGCAPLLRCGYDLHDTMKRMREDEVLASSCKRMR